MTLKIYRIVYLLMGVSIQAFAQQNLSDEYWRAAEKASLKSDFTGSLVLYEKAYALVKRSDQARAANLCNDMSSAHFANRQYNTSLRYCHDGLAHLKKLSQAPDSLYFKLFSSLATMHSALENSDSSAYYFQAADAILDANKLVEAQIPAYVLHHYLHQGRAFWGLHRYNQSVTYFTRAMALAERYRLKDDLDYIESSLAEVYDLLGQHRKALTYRLAASKHNFTDIKRTQGLFSGIAFTYQQLNQLDSALKWQKRSWKLLLAHPENTPAYMRQKIQLVLLNGTLCRQKGQYSEAKKYLDIAEQYQMREFPVAHPLRAVILIEKGYLARSLAQLPQAESFFLQAFSILTLPGPTGAKGDVDLIFPNLALQALQLQASVLFERYKISKNPVYLFSSFNCFKNLIKLKRSAYFDAAEDTEERHFLSNEGYDLFREAIPVAYAYYQKNPSAATLQETFSWFEEANATYLYDVIRDKKIQSEKLPPALLLEERNLAGEYARLSGAKNSSSVAGKQELNKLQIRWYKLRQKIREKYSSDLSKKNASMDFSAVQKELEPESAFISYKWFDDKIYAFLITADKAQITSWPVNKALLETYLSGLQKEFSNNPGFGTYDGAPAAIGCYKILFEPIKKLITGKNRLVIARDWRFNFLPFEVLETGTKTNNYLATRYAFSYTYSASFFWNHPFQTKNEAYSFASQKQSDRSLIVTPFIKEQEIANTPWSHVSSLKDVEAIGGESIWGNRATKQNFLSSGFGYHILHLATHAQVSDDNPNDSFIQFFPGIDSRLYLSEIYSLPLHATRLVILSACSAGDGKSLRGEGNISLSHAIAQAGCPSVITTTWEANDYVIGFLSIRLHHYLDEGQPLDEALKMARLDFFNNKELKKYGHPYYWANLTLIGNDEPVYPKPFFTYSFVTLAGCLLVILLVLAAIFRIRKRKSRYAIAGGFN